MSVEQVIKELNSLNEIYEQLLDTAQIKKTVVINNDVAELTRLMTLENRLLKQIDHIEQRRAVSMSAFLKEKGIRSNLNLTITEIARLVFDPDEKKALLEIRDTLVENGRALKRENEIIQQLIEQSMQFIDFTLNILIDHEDDLIYQNPAQQSSQYPKNTHFLDTKA